MAPPPGFFQPRPASFPAAERQSQAAFDRDFVLRFKGLHYTLRHRVHFLPNAFCLFTPPHFPLCSQTPALILLFYLVFYCFLAGMFALTMWVMLLTLDDNVPRYRDRVPSPGQCSAPFRAPFVSQLLSECIYYLLHTIAIILQHQVVFFFGFFF